MGGTDEPSNLKKVTVEEHAQAHKELYEKYGHWQDKLAWQGLSKIIDSKEVIKLAYSYGGKMGKGKKLNELHKKKIGISNSKPKTGKALKACIDNFKKASELNRGKTRPKKTKELISISNKKYWSKVKNRPWQRKTFIIDNKEYIGLEKVIQHFNISVPTVYNRIKNKKFTNWKIGKFKNE